MNVRAAATWACFEIAKRKFLAVNDYQGNSEIIDSEMNYYGSWMDLEKFKKRIKAGEDLKL